MPKTVRNAKPAPPPVPPTGLPARRVSEVVAGVDTHADTHTVAALDQIGGRLGTATFPTTTAGCQQLLGWLRGFGPVGRVGVEGTGSYGAGLTRYLLSQDVTVLEVNRPNRQVRRVKGKSDPIDADNAARAVLAGVATALPKTRDGVVEAVRVLFTTRSSAVTARTAAINQLRSLLLTGPDPLRAQLAGLTAPKLVAACAGLRPGPELTDPVQATKKALHTLARRILTLDAEITQVTALLDPLVADRAPQLVADFGVGTLTAAQLLITAGDNPHRLATPEAFVALCGASPIPVSTGRTDRHRLNRGGDRQANRALYTIALSRMRHQEQTRTFIAARIAAGKTKKDAIRILKRYLARHIYHLLLQPPTTPALAA
jgi:transposase